MDDTKVMLRSIINGQSSMKSELLMEIKKLNKRIDKLEIKMDDGFEKITKRVDKIGKSVAYLEDDAPTVEEFEKLVNRVAKIEHGVAFA